MVALDGEKQLQEYLSGEDVMALLEVASKSLADKSPEDRSAEVHHNCRYTLPGLEYFGADHAYNSDHPQFALMKKSFQEFVDKYPNPVVLVESSLPRQSPDSESAIARDGERGFVAFLARERGIAVECLEPSRKDEIEYLQKYFSEEQIECYYFLRAIRGYQLPRAEGSSKVEFDVLARSILAHHETMYGKLAGWEHFGFNLEHLRRIYNELTGEPLDFYKGVDVDPRGDASVINQVANKCSLYRDFCHLRTIKEQLEAGNQVFVVNGKEHAVIQKAVLERL